MSCQSGNIPGKQESVLGSKIASEAKTLLGKLVFL